MALKVLPIDGFGDPDRIRTLRVCLTQIAWTGYSCRIFTTLVKLQPARNLRVHGMIRPSPVSPSRLELAKRPDLESATAGELRKRRAYA